MTNKPDATEITEHMESLAASLDGSRKWWPSWVFRSDHIENTAAILNSGKLLSRAAAEQQGVLKKDAASAAHVQDMTSRQRRYVRLYFRPKTPTQYANEGIRPRAKYEYGGAHMPVPVYLLFSCALLTRQGVFFTRGRLAPGTEIGDSAEFLRGIEFLREVYHDGPVGERGDPSRRILNARNSEVIVDDELNLVLLKHIVCRSAPERDALINLLTPTARKHWIERIALEGRRQFFYKRGTFVQEVTLESTFSSFTFYTNIDSDWRGPFELDIQWDGGTWRGGHYTNKNFTVTTDPLKVTLGQTVSEYRVRIWLNGDLAYIGRYAGEQPSSLLG